MDNVTRRVFAAGAALAVLGLATGAAAQQPVKIGVIYPLSGNSASAGNYSKMAIEVGADVDQQRQCRSRQDHAARQGRRPAGPGRRQDPAHLRRQPGHAGRRPEPGAAPDLRGEGGGHDRRLPVGHHRHRERHRRAPRHSRSSPPNRSRPISPSAASSGSSAPRRSPSTSPAPTRPSSRSRRRPARRSARSRSCTRTPSTATRSPASSPSSSPRTACRSPRRSPTRPIRPTCSRRCCSSRRRTPTSSIFISYTSDAILYAKTMKELNWKPGDHDRRQCRLQRSGLRQEPGRARSRAWSTARPSPAASRAACRRCSTSSTRRRPAATSLDDVSARGLQGFLVMADAINRAGSTDPAKIQAALKATDLPASQMVTGYDGVKFDDKGQNVLASSLDHADAAAASTSRSGRRTGPPRRSSCPTRAGERSRRCVSRGKRRRRRVDARWSR